jgi:hypothetical protein
VKQEVDLKSLRLYTGGLVLGSRFLRVPAATHNKIPSLLWPDLGIGSAMTQETHCIDGASQAQGIGLAGRRSSRCRHCREIE